MALEVTDERTGDGKMLKALVRQTKKSINGDDIDALYYCMAMEDMIVRITSTFLMKRRSRQ